MKVARTALSVFVLSLLLGLASCATMQPPGTSGPRGADYPPVYETDEARRTSTTSAISRLLSPGTNGNESGPALNPVTLTIEGLPANNRAPAYLPRLGTAAQMSEEETRESLRRFIQDWRDLIGADPAKLSLVNRVDQPDGIKVATYEQRPFRYPLRGNFGKLEIRFSADRRIVNLTSSCIPDADRVQTALAAIAPKLKAEDAVNQILNGSVAYAGAGGVPQNLKLTANQLSPKELVVFVRPAVGTNTLEFHISWEVEVTGASVRRVYVDAVNGEIISSE